MSKRVNLSTTENGGFTIGVSHTTKTDEFDEDGERIIKYEHKQYAFTKLSQVLKFLKEELKQEGVVNAN